MLKNERFFKRKRKSAILFAIISLCLIFNISAEESPFENKNTTSDVLAAQTTDAAIEVAKGNYRLGTTKAGKAVIDYYLQSYGTDLPDWAKRIEFEARGTENGKPEYGIMTVQPLWQSNGQRNTVFLQARIGNFYQLDESRMTSNIGIGYRQLFLNNTVLAGVNVFHDRDWRRDHNRASLGGELRWHAFDLNANAYWGMTDGKNVGTGLEEKALDGHDAILAMQLPYLPWARVRYKESKWDIAGRDDLDAWKAGLEMDLHQNLQLEASYADDNYSEKRAIVQVRWMLGGNTNKPVAASSRLVDSKAYEMRDMSKHVLDKVERTNRIVVNRTGSGIVIGRAD